ncbi:MAG: helix-turn-helix transcriptional regulator [Rhizobiaceae bacterium]|nr:helix-turn-helix transcriptional regulator [Rhizobiaceae bacterium]MCV0405436.1 helix-turn-helix transcriptional regulator [Rhizobiaceae bacterium]
MNHVSALPPRATEIGPLLREWRNRRRMSQLDLALEAEISQRHLSFVESGRAAPSRDMILHLADHLDVPLRQRNHLLLAAGFAPTFTERAIDDPDLEPAMKAVERVLKVHEPNPAIAVDRHWNLVAANDAIKPFMAAATDPKLLEPPVNVLRLSLHPQGLAPLIVNLGEWRAHLFERLKRLVDASGDPKLIELEAELQAYPGTATRTPPPKGEAGLIAVPLRLRFGPAILSFISTITVFGTALDVTLSELAVESFFPADEETAAALRQNLR